MLVIVISVIPVYFANRLTREVGGAAPTARGRAPTEAEAIAVP